MGIDPDIANWVLEFLLRQPLEDQTLKSILRALPPPDDKPNLKKSVLLKKLESDLLLNSVSVTTLELLEQLEETEFILGNETVSNTMKQAYCAAAVECTVKNLKTEDEGKRFNFFEAVRVLWKGKIAKMKINMEKGGLGSEALWEWKDEIEAALWDDDATERIVKKSDEINGFEAVNAYIREEREKMGPSFLELVAERMRSDAILQGILGVDGIDQVAGKESPPPRDNGVAGGINAGADNGVAGGSNALGDNGVSERSNARGNNGVAGGCNAGGDNGVEGGSNAGGDNGVAERSNAGGDNGVAGGSNAGGDNGVAGGSNARGDNGVAGRSNAGGDNGVAGGCNAGRDNGVAGGSSNAGGSNAGKEINKGKTKLREKHLAVRRSRGLASGKSRGTKIVDPNETTNEPAHKKYKVPSSAEVHKTRVALELSSLDLQAVVRDPLPDAIKIAQAISSEARTNGPQQPAEEARPNEPQQPAEGATTNEPQQPAEEARNNEPQLPAEDNHASAAGVAQAPCGNMSNAPRPSLMERNSTAHTWEWDESIDESQEDRACRGVAPLPSPSRINISPLNQYKVLDLKHRRKRRKWSLQEEDTLRTEVDKYGKGQWKLILSLNRAIFEGRTEVDLKDKWRNMTRC